MNRASINIDTNVNNVIFGNTDDKSISFNVCCLYAKWYIHKCRNSQRERDNLMIDYGLFINNLKEKILVLKEVFIHNISGNVLL